MQPPTFFQSLPTTHPPTNSLTRISQLQPAAAQPSTLRAQRHKGIHPPTLPSPGRPVTQTEELTRRHTEIGPPTPTWSHTDPGRSTLLTCGQRERRRALPVHPTSSSPTTAFSPRVGQKAQEGSPGIPVPLCLEQKFQGKVELSHQQTLSLEP